MWSADVERAGAVAEQLECGTAWVNAHVAARPAPALRWLQVERPRRGERPLGPRRLHRAPGPVPRQGLTATAAMDPAPATVAAALRRRPGCTGSRTRGCSPATARSSTTSCGPGCSTPASCAARSPGPAIVGIDASAALGARRRARRVHRRGPQPRRARAVVHDRSARTSPTRPARRWPRARSASSAIRSRSSSPTTATSPRTRPTSSTSTTTRCPRSSTTSPPHDADELVHEALRRQRRRAAAAARRPRRLDEACSTRPPTSSSETIHQQAYAAVPMETRGHRRRVVAATGAHDLGRRRRRRTRCGRSAPGCSASPSTGSG